MADAMIDKELSSEDESSVSVSEHEKVGIIDTDKSSMSSQKSGKRKRKTKSKYDILDEKYDRLNGKLDYLTNFIGQLGSRQIDCQLLRKKQKTIFLWMKAWKQNIRFLV